MGEKSSLFKKFEKNHATWPDFQSFLELNEVQAMPFFELARKRTIKKFGNKLKIYIPNKRFPSISLTGRDCALECLHCDKKYLNGMKPIKKNKELEDFLFDLAAKNGTGVLISGGCDSDGSVPLREFMSTIKKIKGETNLIINTHTGLLNENTAKALAEAGIDIVSFDVTMDENIINEIYRMEKKSPLDYKQALYLLKKYRLNVVPHICIGLYYGKLHKELEAIKFLKESNINPSLIVFIALIPPNKSEITFQTPDPLDLAKIIAITRFNFPKTEISLGCMRPRGGLKVDIEKITIMAGITRLEIPSRKTIEWLMNFDPHVSFEFFSACCAIPEKFDAITRSKESDIKGYLKILKQPLLKKHS
ncbi:MAG: radical SAM protein [Promethearchaeota archaeon]